MTVAEIEAQQARLIREYLATYVPPVLIVAPPVAPSAEVVPIKKRLWGHRSDVVQRPLISGRHNRFRKGKRKKKVVAA